MTSGGSRILVLLSRTKGTASLRAARSALVPAVITFNRPDSHSSTWVWHSTSQTISRRDFHGVSPLYTESRVGSSSTEANKEKQPESTDKDAIESNALPDLPDSCMENPYVREKIQCVLCKYNVPVNYKNVKLLAQFISPYTGMAYGRHITRLCIKQQERVEKAIETARATGLMAVALKEEMYLKDPKLFDPNKPVRPHRF
ncbi:unnamed protein product [Darwinula stevensoni]|uniref:Mitochondrial ribosomal protein S18C n=1 Tax=Darwinula stevensoni TaxID=69355 RepID=A0A7R8X933_9CRUS|nr:unnamed protein product [Darwinula stevensoni]CAG0890258.1 unnamed protein product [Darwinula stevensoni]